MGTTELILIALALAMDAFAAAVCKGLCTRDIRRKDAFVVAFFFGGFQAAMPLIGWRTGAVFEHAISAWDHWVVFGVLAFIGGRMIKEALNPCDGDEYCEPGLQLRELLFLSVATSIDALAAGFAFALLPGTSVIAAVAWIGSITFLLSYIGVMAGSRLNARFRTGAEIAGGAVLIAIGAKTLLEHLSLFA